MRTAYPFDLSLHAEGSAAAGGRCTYHPDDGPEGSCLDEAVVSFEDEHGRWQAGCTRALEQLVESGEIEPLGQGA